MLYNKTSRINTRQTKDTIKDGYVTLSTTLTGELGDYSTLKLAGIVICKYITGTRNIQALYAITSCAMRLGSIPVSEPL